MSESILLPRSLFPATLQGQLVTLRPMNLTLDIPILYSLTNGSPIKTESVSIEAYNPDQTIWEFMYWPRSGTQHYMEEFYRSNYDTCHFFTIFDNETNAPIGSIGYGYIYPEHLTVEIIKVWLSFAAQGGGKCTEAVNLMVEHAFKMGYRTIYWRASNLNKRSTRIAEKTGFKLEVFATDAVIMYESSIFEFHY